ncbi:cation transporter HKT2;4-like [Miscanthus floridulus]|uniref:cation transporter HKT2;4-like n=1 Tax=Miscanthus floridulus TaxID=154761 RepID=UPI00345A8CB8
MAGRPAGASSRRCSLQARVFCQRAAGRGLQARVLPRASAAMKPPFAGRPAWRAGQGRRTVRASAVSVKAPREFGAAASEPAAAAAVRRRRWQWHARQCALSSHARTYSPSLSLVGFSQSKPLARKGISAALFSVSTTVSSFTNGGLLPTTESMAVFAANRGLLLLLAAQILAGSTVLPVFLRLAVSATRGLARVLFLFTGRGGPVEELVPMDMENSAAAAGFGHLLPSDTRAASLAATVVAVAAAAAALLCCLNWNSAVFAGQGWREEEETVAEQHAAVTAGLQRCSDEVHMHDRRTSQFTAHIWILELLKLTYGFLHGCSAYGNVGLSTGYSCSRLLPAAEATATCHDNRTASPGGGATRGDAGEHYRCGVAGQR